MSRLEERKGSKMRIELEIWHCPDMNWVKNRVASEFLPATVSIAGQESRQRFLISNGFREAGGDGFVTAGGGFSPDSRAFAASYVRSDGWMASVPGGYWDATEGPSENGERAKIILRQQTINLKGGSRE